MTNTGPNAGAFLGESFWKLPNKRFNPDYYATIKKPISMGQIRNKMIKGEYGNITEMTSDLFLMLDNAKKWFPPTNRVHKVSLTNDLHCKGKIKVSHSYLPTGCRKDAKVIESKVGRWNP